MSIRNVINIWISFRTDQDGIPKEDDTSFEK